MSQSLVNGETEEAASGRSENGILHSGIHVRAPEPVLTDGPKGLESPGNGEQG